MSYVDSFVKELTIKDFDPPYLKDKSCSILLIYLPGCPHCEKLKPTWKLLGMKAAFFKVYALSAHEEEAIETLSEKGVVIEGFPTIFLFKEGKLVEEYVGNRDINSLMTYILNNCR